MCVRGTRGATISGENAQTLDQGQALPHLCCSGGRRRETRGKRKCESDLLSRSVSLPFFASPVCLPAWAGHCQRLRTPTTPTRRYQTHREESRTTAETGPSVSVVDCSTHLQLSQRWGSPRKPGEQGNLARLWSVDLTVWNNDVVHSERRRNTAACLCIDQQCKSNQRKQPEPPRRGATSAHQAGQAKRGSGQVGRSRRAPSVWLGERTRDASEPGNARALDEGSTLPSQPTLTALRYPGDKPRHTHILAGRVEEAHDGQAKASALLTCVRAWVST
ncbi:hypothetical protein B0T25DRAFT_531909 [Lasiosphaeria hispida]|uniref:Uncharacterized protein n=1 Tax=Lasiosphaeria hispida TaxID=260671 RepID=A0AAJ0HPQ6_9PEZI|nr:hypothetical protein B0T25DRAFT_531909 [Lasiosphaeria hispida]